MFEAHFSRLGMVSECVRLAEWTTVRARLSEYVCVCVGVAVVTDAFSIEE